MNFIQIENQKIPLTDEQAEQLRKTFVPSTALSSIKIGETFKIGEYEFIVLEYDKETTAAILKNFLGNKSTFGSNNNYNGSKVDKICNDFGEKIEAIVGKGNLIEHTVDLTADDGLKDYGSVKRKMALITANTYRRYVDILEDYKPKCWWWTATAYSTPKHEDSIWIKCVSPRGDIYGNDYDYSYGVRPFCILKSNIFVSKI